MRIAVAVLAVLWASGALVARADNPTDQDEVVTVQTRDGDPNYSRLLFGPTGRPLRKGDGYFSDYVLALPGVAVGLTDHLSLAGGVSVIPGFGLGEQLFYVSPKVGYQVSERTAFSVGGLYATMALDSDREALGVLYGVSTFGGRDKSVTVGLGFGDADLQDGFRPSPILMLGGTATVSRHVALVTESWVVLNDDFDLGEQPVGVGVRFFGSRLSADVGVILMPAHLDDVGVLPWASVSYHFGKSHARDARHRGVDVRPRAQSPMTRP
jgi:hypothetical protein